MGDVCLGNIVSIMSVISSLTIFIFAFFALLLIGLNIILVDQSPPFSNELPGIHPALFNPRILSSWFPLLSDPDARLSPAQCI